MTSPLILRDQPCRLGLCQCLWSETSGKQHGSGVLLLAIKSDPWSGLPCQQSRSLLGLFFSTQIYKERLTDNLMKSSVYVFVSIIVIFILITNFFFSLPKSCLILKKILDKQSVWLFPSFITVLLYMFWKQACVCQAALIRSPPGSASQVLRNMVVVFLSSLAESDIAGKLTSCSQPWIHWHMFCLCLQCWLFQVEYAFVSLHKKICPQPRDD